MAHELPKITLDTNGVINLFDADAPTRASYEALTNLFRLVLAGHASLAITTRVEDDMLSDRDAARRSAMLGQLKLFPVVGTEARWDVSRWDDPDVYADNPAFLEIQRIVFPGLLKSDKRYKNKRNDVDHLVGHLLNKRDIFVTEDKDILRRRTELKSGPHVTVMHPSDCVSYIEALANPPARAIPVDGLLPAYHDPSPQGRVIFDYSDNDGEYAIGAGEWMFRTKWSKASDSHIHAYKDGRGMDAIALANGVEAFSQIGLADRLNYSSRVRTAGIGEIVVWRNVNGLYAATRMVDIKDDSRNDNHDELAFDYVILTQGSRDFSQKSTTPADLDVEQEGKE